MHRDLAPRISESRAAASMKSIIFHRISRRNSIWRIVTPLNFVVASKFEGLKLTQFSWSWNVIILWELLPSREIRYHDLVLEADVWARSMDQRRQDFGSGFGSVLECKLKLLHNPRYRAWWDSTQILPKICTYKATKSHRESSLEIELELLR